MTTIGSSASCSSASDYTYAARGRQLVDHTQEANAQHVRERERLSERQPTFQSDPNHSLDILA